MAALNPLPACLSHLAQRDQAIRQRALEDAAQIVDEANLAGPYEAIGAAPVIRALGDTAKWPSGCWDPTSCEGHKACMYTRCRHEMSETLAEDIQAAISVAEAARHDA